ncbi:MAG TPA: multicopper oxidase family protein [Jiangellaceae bacterium]
MQDHTPHLIGNEKGFPTHVDRLPEAGRPPVLELADRDVLDLRVSPVVKQLHDTSVRMLAYNESVPGPTLRVRQGSEIVVKVINEGDLDTTVHWHGLRLQNRYDGVEHATQAPIPVGGEFTYRIQFPDPGIYWYHPHIREDYAQELGLYGNIMVLPDEDDYWPPVDREFVLTLDDILLVNGKVAPFSTTETNYAAMGRFGNLLLTSGDPDFRVAARTGEVVRLWLTNTASARVFNVRLPGARMKLVGGDSGRVEHEEFVSEVLLGPSERAVVDVLLAQPGELQLEHRTPRLTYPLATIAVGGSRVTPLPDEQFARLRGAPELRAERHRLAGWLEAAPDKILALVAEISHQGHAMAPGMGHASNDEGSDPEHEHGHGAVDGIEWEDDMAEVNRLITSAAMSWKFVDRTLGTDTTPSDWRFTAGDRVKIRLVNELESDHPMHHPFHLHGAGRFLILARDGKAEPNLAWKDTVLVRTGQTVDILFDVTNPGLWMAHCHIPEHMHSGMMFSFVVDSSNVATT